jgi:hypothetical protein
MSNLGVGLGGVSKMSAKEVQSTVQPEAYRNDFLDVAIGFGGSFGFFFLLATIATIVSLFIK